MCHLLLKAGHEVTEGRLIICVCGLSLFKGRRFRVLLHSVPVYAVCRLHDLSLIHISWSITPSSGIRGSSTSHWGKSRAGTTYTSVRSCVEAALQ